MSCAGTVGDARAYAHRACEHGCTRRPRRYLHDASAAKFRDAPSPDKKSRWHASSQRHWFQKYREARLTWRWSRETERTAVPCCSASPWCGSVRLSTRLGGERRYPSQPVRLVARSDGIPLPRLRRRGATTAWSTTVPASPASWRPSRVAWPLPCRPAAACLLAWCSCRSDMASRTCLRR